MAGTVGSAVVQETVSGVFSYLSSNRKEQASRDHNVEKLEMVHAELELALERSTTLPITNVALLRQRKMYKRAYEECGHVLHRCKLRVLEEEDKAEALPKRIIHVMKSSMSSLLAMNKDDHQIISSSDVRRFEWFADKANKFVRDLETGCSLAHYRFLIPLTRHLLEGKTLDYSIVHGTQTLILRVEPLSLEERGVEARIRFSRQDSCRIPLKNFTLRLILRLSESTDIVGITIKCLQSLGPRFRSFAEDAVGSLAQLPTQDVVYTVTPPPLFYAPAFRACQALLSRTFRPDPLCCREEDGQIITPLADEDEGIMMSSELSHEFPEQVIGVHFTSYISAAGYHRYNLSTSSTTDDEASRNTVREWPPLELTIAISPHSSSLQKELEGSFEIAGGREKNINASLHQMEEMAVSKAIDSFVSQPELKDYLMVCVRAHGSGFILRLSPDDKYLCQRNLLND
ncbi:hypothetical protein E2562_021815 [Oryza meyeriana var. granulata]|uniref:Uncharacterized protein n=1 Tax=Oryza meyeriana var. granulata TaxID=110450 RepID=A0A6G1ENA8_9ORYZ|nr:hypothetical protein E2562_021815 [Oryza meyeriana var. granulata]